MFSHRVLLVSASLLASSGFGVADVSTREAVCSDESVTMLQTASVGNNEVLVASGGEKALRDSWPHFGPGVHARERAPTDLSKVQQGFVPKVVAVAGMPRTGSTSLTILIQTWLILADTKYEPFKMKDWKGYAVGGTAEPWVGHVDKEKFKMPADGVRRVSNLVKLHEPVEWVEKVADIVFLSHREPLEEMLSSELSWHNLLNGKNTDKDCPHLMEKQRRQHKFAESCCGGCAYDLQMEDLRDRPLNTVKEVGVALGIQESAITYDVLQYVHKLLEEHRPDKVENGLPKKNQEWHSDAERAEVRDAIAKKHLQTAECKAWNDRRGRFK